MCVHVHACLRLEIVAQQFVVLVLISNPPTPSSFAVLLLA